MAVSEQKPAEVKPEQAPDRAGSLADEVKSRPAQDAAEASARKENFTVKTDKARVSIAEGTFKDGDKVDAKQAAALKVVPGVEVTD